MNSKLGRDVDRAAERARERDLDARTATTECEECGASMVHEYDHTYRCPDCQMMAEYHEPDEDNPKGSVSTWWEED